MKDRVSWYPSEPLGWNSLTFRFSGIFFPFRGVFSRPFSGSSFDSSPSSKYPDDPFSCFSPRRLPPPPRSSQPYLRRRRRCSTLRCVCLCGLLPLFGCHLYFFVGGPGNLWTVTPIFFFYEMRGPPRRITLSPLCRRPVSPSFFARKLLSRPSLHPRRTLFYTSNG